MENLDNLTIDRLISGDIGAFRQLVDRYKKKVYFIAYDIVHDHHEAEDISQDVFIKVFRSLPKFRKDAKMSSWIYQIAVNTCIDVVRKRKARPQVQLEDWGASDLHGDIPGRGSPAADPARSAEAALMRRNIKRALSRVTPRERVVFVMRHFNDFQINEIADVLEVSSGTVKSLLFRALKKLRKELNVNPGRPCLEANYE